MVTLYVRGQKVGTWSDGEKFEFRNENGDVVGTFVPSQTASDPDWVRAITPEETARRMAEPGFTFEEMKKRLGWE
jgi:hypothetical protein